MDGLDQRALHADGGGCTCPLCLSAPTDGAPASAGAADTKTPFGLDQAVAVITRDSDKWGGSTVTYGFRTVAPPASYGPEGKGFSAFSAEQQTAARAVMALWDELLAIGFQEAPESTAQILFGNSTHEDFHAYANFPGQGRGGDVWINPNSASNLQLALGRYGRDTLIHEVGHALGLNHPGDYDAGDETGTSYADEAQYRQDNSQYTVMSYFAASATGASHGSPTQHAWAPLLHDIAAAQRLYGPELTTRTGDTVYGYNASPGVLVNLTSASLPVAAIWDAGGVDTLDFSGSARGVELDLRQGAFSSVNGLVANLAVAWGAQIENGVGSAGADRLTGNELPNVLTGGAGDDTIAGGGGVDTAVFAGSRADYEVTGSGTAVTVRALSGAGTDTLTGVERLRFDDHTLDLVPSPLLPTVTVAGQRLLESSEHDTVLLFEVVLSRPSEQSLTLSYATRAGTATAGADFQEASGTLTFAPGEVAKLVPVTVRQDRAKEADETFSLVVTAANTAEFPLFAAGEQVRGLATILDDDVGGTDAVPDTNEGAAALAVGSTVTGSIETDGERDRYRIELTAGESYVFTLQGRTTGAGSLEDPWLILLDGTGTRIKDSDDDGPGRTSLITYTPTVSGTHYLVATGWEDEFTYVGTYTLGATRGTALPVAPILSVEDATAVEGDGNDRALTFTLRLSAPAATDVTVHVATEDGTAAAGIDFEGVARTVTIAAGQTSATVTVPVLGDTAREGDESLTLRLFTPSGATLQGEGRSLAAAGTLLNDDQGGAAAQPGLLLARATGDVLAWQPGRGAEGFRFGGAFDPAAVAVAGAGDFSGDGRPDLLLGLGGGRYLTWNVQAGAAGFADLPDLGAFRPVAVGNMVGTPADDLLIQDPGTGTLRFLDGATRQGVDFITLQPGFTVLGAADLDGRGTEDVLFQNGATGGLFYWNGSGFTDLLALTPGSGWRVEGLGNFLGDGADDLLLFNTQTRALVFWNPGDGSAGFRDFVVLPAGWEVAGVGDVDGDGRDDPVIRNTAGGQALYWTGSRFGDLGGVLDGVELLGIGQVEPA
ncbi:MAG TPA: Calx-beta domain-containing protein [Azospirillaceae bacterium]|nr:Calx-beta domain-containing protein [Azospirillaceae bacterium]